MAEQLTTISPSTYKPILIRQGLLPAEVDALLGHAVNAFEKSRALSLEDRQRIVGKAVDILEQKTDVLAKELTEQIGRPIAYTAVEIKTAVARARYLIKKSSAALRDTDGEPEENFKRFIRKEPVGPVLIIFAWNVGVHLTPGNGHSLIGSSTRI